MINVVDAVYPQEKEQLEEYLDGSSGYFDEIYVMKKNVFFDFCSWIFPILFTLLRNPPIILNNSDERDIGFICERLTGFYLFQLIQNRDIKLYEENIILTQKLLVNKNTLDKDIFIKLRKLHHDN